MLYPPLNQLTSKVKSKYLIATVAAKRARELYDKKRHCVIRKISLS